MMFWIFLWAIVALVAIVGEVMTTGLFLAFVAVAAAITAVTALFLPVILQAVIFAGISLGSIAVIRPILAEAIGLRGENLLAGPVTQSHLIGRRAVVTETVDALGGQIRIGHGDYWTARPFDDNDTYPPGSRVEVMLIDGLTALVSAVEPPALEHTDTPDVPESTTDTEEKGTLTWTSQ